MSKRKTRCLTWGEPKRWCERSEPPHSVIITYEYYETLCGREDEDVVFVTFNGVGHRPEGLCPSCWSRYKKEYATTAWSVGLNDVD